MAETSLLLWARMDVGLWGRKFAFSWWERREVFYVFLWISNQNSPEWWMTEEWVTGQAETWWYEPLIEPVTAPRKLWFSCMFGFFSSFQFITKRNLLVSLTKSNLGGESVFLSFNDLSFFLLLHCPGTWTPDQHWLRKAASYFPTCHLLFCVPLLASFREILDKENGGEWTLVHLIAEVSRIQCSCF